MLDSAKYVSDLKPDAMKIHSLFVVKNTIYAKQYNDNLLKTIDFEDYVDIVCEQLRNIDQDIVIQRLTGDAKEEDLIAPL